MVSIYDVPTIVARFPSHIGAACAGVQAIATPTKASARGERGPDQRHEGLDTEGR